MYVLKHDFCVCVFLVNGFAALVPLEELKEINFAKQYGIARDPEVIDILDTVSKTKGVFMMFLIVLFSSYVIYVTIGRKNGYVIRVNIL